MHHAHSRSNLVPSHVPLPARSGVRGSGFRAEGANPRALDRRLLHGGAEACGAAIAGSPLRADSSGASDTSHGPGFGDPKISTGASGGGWIEYPAKDEGLWTACGPIAHAASELGFGDAAGDGKAGEVWEDTDVSER